MALNKVLIGFALIVALLLGAVLIGPSLINWNDYKGEILAGVKEATGREVAIDGDLSMSLLPAPTLSAEGIRFANIDGGSDPEMVRISSFELRLAFAPLLSGRIQVERIRLVEPRLLLEVTADGRANWALEDASTTPGSDSQSAAAGSSDGLNVSLDTIELENASIVYRDARSGLEESLTGLSATASASAVNGPFQASGSTVAKGLPLMFDVAIGAYEASQPLPVRLALKLEGTPGEAVVALTVSDLEAEPRLKGEVKLSAERIGALAAVLAPGAALPGLADQPLSLSAGLAGAGSQFSVNDLSLSLGAMQAAGAISIDISDGMAVDAALEVGRLNLDELLARAGAAAAAGPSASDTGASSGAADEAVMRLPTLPANLHGTVSLGIDGVTYRGRVIRQVQLNASLDKGKAVLREASALLPGGSDFRLSGGLANEGDEPVFRGRVELASDNLRAMLEWLAVDVAQVPPGRLATLVLTADIDARPSLVQIAGLNLRLDNSTITGGIAARVQRRPSFGLSLNVDKLNLDGYLPQTAAGDSGAAGAGGKASGPNGSGDGTSVLALLEDFDTNFSLQVGQLAYGGVGFRDIALELTLFGGTMTVKRASIADALGVAVAASGAATGFSATPALDLRAEAKATDLSALARGLDLGDGIDWRRIDSVAVNGIINGTAESVVADLNGQAAGAKIKLHGTAKSPLDAAILDLNLDLSHPDMRALLKRVGVIETKPGGGPLSLSINAKGRMEDLALAVKGDLDGLALDSAGQLRRQNGQPDFEMTLEARHNDFVALVNSFGADYRPALEEIGAVSLKAKAKGNPDTVSISAIDAAVGPAQLRGEASLTLNRPTPHVNAALETSEIIVDWFLPRERQGAASGTGRSGSDNQTRPSNDNRWSRAPLDLTGMDLVDADVTLTAAGLVFQRYPFVKPRMVMQLAAGTLTIRELKSGLFGGNVGLSAVVESRPVTAFALNTKLVGANIEEALKTALDLDTVTGRLDFNGSFKARGNSQWDLVNNLQGNASLHAENGVIRGFDMQRFSDRMQKLTENAHFIDLVNRAFSGGETRYRTVDGTWQVENGVARTTDTKAQIDAAEATLNGAVSLPTWRLNLQSRMRLTEHANAPNMGVDLTGPIDAPRHDVKTAELERWLLGRAARELLPKALGKKGGDIGKALEGVLGGGGSGQGQSSQGQSSQGQSPQGPSNDSGSSTAPAINDLLKGLLKK